MKPQAEDFGPHLFGALESNNHTQTHSKAKPALSSFFTQIIWCIQLDLKIVTK